MRRVKLVDSPELAAGYCAKWLRILADETRLAVVQELLSGPRHVSELNARLRVEQSLLSHHLQVLRRAGMVVSQRSGKSVRYCLSSEIQRSPAEDAIQLGCCSIRFDRGFGRQEQSHALSEPTDSERRPRRR